MLCRTFSFTLTLLVLYGRLKDASGCALDPCPEMTGCLYGRARDQNGCIICGCFAPCELGRCPEGSYCRFEKNATTNTFSDECVQCPVIPCPSTCRTNPPGFNTCTTCSCGDECQFNPCRVDQKCVPDECYYTGDCRDYSHYCADASEVLTTPYSVRIINDLPTTTSTMEEIVQEAMRKCCPSLGLSNSCLENCLANPAQLFSDFSSCFRSQKIWDYMSCISASRQTGIPVGARDLLGSLTRHVGSKILNFRLLHKESIQDSETEIEAKTETDPAGVDAGEGQVHEDEYQP